MKRELERHKRQLARSADRKRLQAIKAKLRELRKTRPVRLRQIREACRAGRSNARARIRTLREETRIALRESVQRLREAERGTCETAKAQARDGFATMIAGAMRDREMQRAHMEREYGRRRGAGRVSAAQLAKEARNESDDEVRRNLPPELVSVFNRVRSTIKPGRRRTRTEAFLEWVHDNPDEAHSIVFDAVERDVDRLIKEREEVERRLAGGYDGNAALDALESEVPF